MNIELIREPDYRDEYGRSCFSIEQIKGVREFQTADLYRRARNSGYASLVGNSLYIWAADQIRELKDSPVTVLEIGGGEGGMFDLIEPMVLKYINIEPGCEVLSTSGEKRLDNEKFFHVRCSAEKIPLPDESADIILSLASLDHIPDYEAALSETGRLLHREGFFVIVLNNRRSWWKKILSRTKYLKHREASVAAEHYFQWSFKECRVYLSSFFDVQDIETTTYLPYVPGIWRILPFIDFLGKVALPGYGASILAVCRKKRI